MVSADAPPRDPTEVLGRRVAAYAIDVALLAVVSVIIVGGAGHTTIRNAPNGACRAYKSLICLQSGHRVYLWNRSGFLHSEVVVLLAAFVDFVLLQALVGASIGKLCVGLRVVDDRGEKANLFRVLGRWLLLAIDAGLFVVGVVTTLLTHPHRRLGDLACGTYVVATSSVGHSMVATGSNGLYAAGSVPAGFGAPASWQPPVTISQGPTLEDVAAAPVSSVAIAPPDPLAPAPQWTSPPVSSANRAPVVERAPAWSAPPVAETVPELEPASELEPVPEAVPESEVVPEAEIEAVLEQESAPDSDAVTAGDLEPEIEADVSPASAADVVPVAEATPSVDAAPVVDAPPKPKAAPRSTPKPRSRSAPRSTPKPKAAPPAPSPAREPEPEPDVEVEPVAASTGDPARADWSTKAWWDEALESDPSDAESDPA